MRLSARMAVEGGSKLDWFDWFRLDRTKLKPTICSPMLILAIDTALEACAAAVLDTDAGSCLRRKRM